MRVKRGFASRRKHNKIRKMASGFRGRRKNVYKFARDAVHRSLAYAYRDRRARKRQFRRLWIIRINAAARREGLSYNRLMSGLKKADISIDRKILADLAVNDSESFSALVSRAREALEATV
ncbi:MAG: 50S ribosomal protein L20 [Candidatus Dadabacteria bacterium]|nr:MAG: 50S ribosomal protein L20 [Candidatus Dadabacteria bacterium]